MFWINYSKALLESELHTLYILSKCLDAAKHPGFQVFWKQDQVTYLKLALNSKIFLSLEILDDKLSYMAS